MAEAGAAPSKAVFIDKMPLNLVFLPLIAKLFPSAKILLALRDPRDVVLSCLRRRFAMNAACMNSPPFKAPPPITRR